jgi:hypothetical protein
MIRHYNSILLASTAMSLAHFATEPKQPLGTGHTDSIETGGQSGFAGSISMDIGGEEPTVKTSNEGEQSDHIEVGEGAEGAAEDGPAKDETTDDDAGGDDKADEPGDDTAEDGDLPELPEFKADDPEVVKSYDEVFKTDGKLKMEALSKQWWNNAASAEDGQGHLDEGTYAYLDSLGIPKEMVEAAEAGQAALNTQTNQALYARAGGKPNLDLALRWAANGDKPAYTPAQQKAFNAAIDKGGETAADAIDLLMSRYTKAANVRVSPNKSLGEHAHGGGGEGAAGDVFKSKQEWLDARKDANGNMSKLAAVSAKYRRSPGAKNW